MIIKDPALNELATELMAYVHQIPPEEKEMAQRDAMGVIWNMREGRPFEPVPHLPPALAQRIAAYAARSLDQNNAPHDSTAAVGGRDEGAPVAQETDAVVAAPQAVPAAAAGAQGSGDSFENHADVAVDAEAGTQPAQNQVQEAPGGNATATTVPAPGVQLGAVPETAVLLPAAPAEPVLQANPAPLDTSGAQPHSGPFV